VDFVIHIIATTIALLMISKLLRGFEIDSWLTALVTAFILGLFHALMASFAEQLGRIAWGILAASSPSGQVTVSADCSTLPLETHPS
jgi:hypothetical protein